MRAKSKLTTGYIVYAVSGTNSISFAIDYTKATTKGLLGFAVERIDTKTGERKFMDGFKSFQKTESGLNKTETVSTYSHPIQSFVWDDFTCYDNRLYEYRFYAVKGKPEKLEHAKIPIVVRIKTEPLFTTGEHDVFFNRGVASSQAYHRKFFNLPPDKITNPAMKLKALNWLSRSLDEAILTFINTAKKGEALLGCFYEFRYEPVATAFKKAIERGVHVSVIIDAKQNGKTDKEGKKHESFPREENLRMIEEVGIPEKNIIKREANKDKIQHNKFMVLLDKRKQAKEVWTGSTNISNGGIHGQTNVGHWVRNAETAEKYHAYWTILKEDPGAGTGDDRATATQKQNAYRKQVEELQENIVFNGWEDIQDGITPVFSPRSGLAMLNTYVSMFDAASNMSCITLAFGINKLFKDYLEDNKETDHISFMLLEKEDKPKKNAKDPFRYIGANENVYKSWGSYINDELYRWAKETTTRHMDLNKHVAYIHSKFLLVDPLSNDPVVVTGSANFSNPSTNDNDENMLIIRGNKRVADIYFTEFNRLFHHFYFRSVYNKTKEKKRTDPTHLTLLPNDKWLQKYKKGNFRYKRVEMFTHMEGFTTLS